MRNNAIILAVFLLVYFVRLATFSQPHFVDGTKIKLTSVLNQEPKISGNLQSFNLSGVKVKTWKYPQFHYGDRIKVIGSIKNNNLEFPEIELVAKKGNTLISAINKIRLKLEYNFKRSLPEPQASLYAGIVLGSKANMPTEFYQNLQKTGVMHMVVASGTNVSILAATSISFLVLFISRKKACLLAFLLVWFYVFLSGADVPIIRAGIMGSLTFMALGLGREDDAWRGLGISAMILLLINPLSFQDLGFQLSFAATFGILFLGTKISQKLKFLPSQLQNDLGQTLGAQLATLPIILLNFGNYSIFSPLANLLLVPVIPWVMRLGLISSLIGFFVFPLGQLLSWFSWPFLTYFVKVVNIFANF